MWLFQELVSGYMAIFDSEEEAKKFVKAYGIKMYDLYGQFPVVYNDYVLEFNEINPDEFNEINPDISDISVLNKIFR